MAATPEQSPMSPDQAETEQKAKPPHGADDGKVGGQTQGGVPAAGNFGGQHAAGTNAQSGRAAGAETERDAPGMSTEKNADDTR